MKRMKRPGGVYNNNVLRSFQLSAFLCKKKVKKNNLFCIYVDIFTGCLQNTRQIHEKRDGTEIMLLLQAAIAVA